MRGKCVTKSLIALSSTVFHVRAMANTKPQRRAGSSASRLRTICIFSWEAISGIAIHDNPLGPGGRDKAPHHLTEQGIFCAILRMAFGPNEPKSSWQAIHVPVGNQQDKTNPEKPGMMLTFTPFLGQRILCSPLGFLTAIAHKIEGSVLGRRQGMQSFLGPPRHQHVDTPIARLQQAAEPPHRYRCWGPTRKFFQGFLPWEEGLHAHQPTQDETVATFPDARHPAKEHRDKQGQISDCDHSRTGRAKGVSDHTPDMPVVLFYHMLLSTLICKAS